MRKAEEEIAQVAKDNFNFCNAECDTFKDADPGWYPARSGPCACVERISALLRAAQDEALEEAANAQPSTAENPNESAYQRGRFDAVMEYQKAIRALKGEK